MTFGLPVTLGLPMKELVSELREQVEALPLLLRLLGRGAGQGAMASSSGGELWVASDFELPAAPAANSRLVHRDVCLGKDVAGELLPLVLALGSDPSLSLSVYLPSSRASVPLREFVLSGAWAEDFSPIRARRADLMIDMLRCRGTS